MLSDPVNMPVGAFAELTVSLFISSETACTTVHYADLNDDYLSSIGDFTRDEALPGSARTIERAFLTGIDVLGPDGARVLVALGDSITDGGSNARWPDRLAARLNSGASSPSRAVANAGIRGNQLLRDGAGSNALARFDRDVLAVPGVTEVVVLEGINDIGSAGLTWAGHRYGPMTAEDAISAYRQLIARAHECGLRILGATLLPFEGKQKDSGYYSVAKETIRQTINRWIREAGEFDGVIDFDAHLRDPGHPSRLLPVYDSGDNLHPSAAGYQAMADAFDLTLVE
jgi:lysophospholipase L1-like esterase